MIALRGFGPFLQPSWLLHFCFSHMSVLTVESTTIDNDCVTVTAIVDGIKLFCPATLLDPAEYAPALCMAAFDLYEDEVLPTDEDALCKYLEGRGLSWIVVDTSDYYID